MHVSVFFNSLFYSREAYFDIGVVVVVIVWYLDLQLPMQSVPMTTNVVSSNPAQTRYTRNNII
jgi:hypothetical protein